MRFLAATASLLLFTTPAFAQQSDFFKPNPNRRELKAIPISTSIRIDGLLDEPEWALTTGATDFIQVEPYQGQPFQFGTVIKVLYNQKYLFVGVICKDPKGKKAIMATDFLRDFDYTRHDLVNLAFDIDWNGLWSVRTKRTDSGWATPNRRIFQASNSVAT